MGIWLGSAALVAEKSKCLVEVRGRPACGNAPGNKVFGNLRDCPVKNARYCAANMHEIEQLHVLLPNGCANKPGKALCLNLLCV
ncbi:MAG TPA: hypothetical protein VN175_02815 [Rhizomicrobium sp.]|nr:hypothetical protein [Rhizomicrobium sp.]